MNVPQDNLFPLGVTAILHTATDTVGDSQTATQKVTVTDATLPVLACPLNSDFAFLPDRGDSQQGSDQYVYDPGNPTPSPRTLGDDEMESRYSKMLGKRKDIAAYRSAPIQEPFKILGPMSAVIYVSSDAPETDLFVRVSEEDPSHRRFLLAEGKSRVRFQGTKPARVEVDFWHISVGSG